MNGILAATVGLLMLGALPGVGQTNWVVTNTFPIGGDGGWDYVTVDAPAHRLFVTRGTHAMAIDETSGKVLGDVTGMKSSHGVAIVPKLGRGFITDGGGTGAIVVFDLKTYAVLGRIAAMPDADGIIYDAKQDRVLAVSGDGGALMTFRPNIDPKNGKMDAPIDLGGKPEFLTSDGSGKVYIDLADKDMVAVVDLASRKVVQRWPVAPGGQPTGLSMDAAGRHLFVGCRKPAMMVVMNADTGRVETSLPIGTGVDATAAAGSEAFASTGDGKLTVVAQREGKFEVVETVETRAGARTMGLDPGSKQAFLPAAEMDPPATPGGRARPKPGTFMIVVVGQR
jgi:DNA-binding beta-propeller fold protein YncE